MKNRLYRSALEIVQEKKIARNAKFLFVPRQLSFSDICRVFYYEYVDPQKSDEIFIKQILDELAKYGLLPVDAVTYHEYRLETLTFHDVFLRTTDGGQFCRGTSINIAEAYAKAIGEVFERTSLRYNHDTRVVKASLKAMVQKNIPYLSPHDFTEPTALQKEKFQSLVFNDNDILSWLPARNLRTKQESWVPAQNVFYNNFINYPGEKVVLMQSTHGAGGGYTQQSAARSAVCEIVHRHFFLSDWYEGSVPEKVDTQSIPTESVVATIVFELQSIGFTVHLMNYSKKAGLPTVVCVLERYGGWSMGASTSATTLGAIERAISEAMATYLWQVQTTTLGGNRVTQTSIEEVRHDFTDSKHTDAYERVMLYSSSHFIKKSTSFRMFLSGVAVPYTTNFDLSPDFDLISYVVNNFGDVYEFEVINDVLALYQYHAVRIIIPKSYPFALNEIYSRPIRDGKKPLSAQLTPFP